MRVNKFKQIVRKYTDEFLAQGGCVTCEFSTSAEGWEWKEPILREATARLCEAIKLNPDLKDARWLVHECETCRGHDASHPLHVSIESIQFWPPNLGDQDLKMVLDCAL